MEIGGNDLPRRITTLAKRKMLIVMMVLMLITMTIMTLILSMAMMVMMMRCIEEYEIGKNDLPHRMTTLAKRRMSISMLVMMVLLLITMTIMTLILTMVMMVMFVERERRKLDKSGRHAEPSTHFVAC